jgi:hypothetical protein
MATLLKIISVFFCTIMILLIIAGLGFHIGPKSFPPYHDTTPELVTVPLPSDLPAPVERYLNTIMGDQIPVIESAVVWGRGKSKIFHVWMPVRFKGCYIPSQEFYRDMEVTWYRIPIITGHEFYLKEGGVFQTQDIFTMDVTDEKITHGQNLIMWSEAVLIPSVFVTDQNIRWEAINASSACLVVPRGEKEDSLLVRFDPVSGFMTQMSAWRYHDQEEYKSHWCVDYSDWKTYHDIMIPGQIAHSWEKENNPWSYMTIDGVEYNVEFQTPQE